MEPPHRRWFGSHRLYVASRAVPEESSGRREYVANYRREECLAASHAKRDPPRGGFPPATRERTAIRRQDLRAGKWIETSAYKFRVNGVVRCADPSPTEKVPEDRPLRVAVKVD